MKIRIDQIKLNIEHDNTSIKKAAARILRISTQDIIDIIIAKKSIDARDKNDIRYVYSVDVIVNERCKIKLSKNCRIINKDEKYIFNKFGSATLNYPPVVVGSGPAGLFCTYMLAISGYNPILIERGEDVDSRKKTVEHFWNTNELNLNSNVQFGEGGAGTFSDGKLNTRTKDKFFRNKLVLETFVKFGAPDNILYDAQPHIGTDILCDVVKNMRQEIVLNGGKVLFNTALTEIIYKNNTITAVKVNNKDIINTDAVVLALGHSARDTFEMLYDSGIKMEQKAFAMGVRVEHRQKTIDEAQYGIKAAGLLPPATYKLTTQTANGRGVYSFCMCPGGYVVNSSSEHEMLTVNGMSYSDRNSENANSAIVVTVRPDDFESSSPLAGIEFQRKLEHAAYIAGEGLIPQQTFADFDNHTNKGVENISTNTKGKTKYADLNSVLPPFMSNAIKEGIKNFGLFIKGFDDGNAILSAIESRTSCPVRILRDENFESNIKGVYPCGEGAGYAGGITSAAMDGIKVYEAIAGKYSNK